MLTLGHDIVKCLNFEHGSADMLFESQMSLVSTMTGKDLFQTHSGRNFAWMKFESMQASLKLLATVMYEGHSFMPKTIVDLS